MTFCLCRLLTILWHISRCIRNRLQRSRHGNTRGDWARQNKLPAASSTLNIGTINTNGFSSAIKQISISNSKLDVVALTETHLQSHLHTAFCENWKSFHCHFSPDPNSRHYAGVAILLKKNQFWKTIPITWPADHPCHKYMIEGRLIAVQAFIGHGGSSLTFYNIYAPSGARWEPNKKTQLHELLAAITQDHIARGQLPSILLGDFNMTISESVNLTTLIKNRTWCDSRKVASPSMAIAPTCHVGPSSGSIIDHILVSPSLFDQIFDFQVTKHTAFKDHSEVSIQLCIPHPTQIRRNLRRPDMLNDLRLPQSHDFLIHFSSPDSFAKAIQSRDIDTAYKIFLSSLNQVLGRIAQKSNKNFDPKKHSRSNIQFHEQRRHPPAIGAHASTMQTRKIFKAYNQAKEVIAARPGYRRDRTWQHIVNAIPYAPEHLRSQITNILQSPATADGANQLVELFEISLEEIIKTDNQQRINKWKLRMRSHISQSYSWLKKRSKKQIIAFQTDNIPQTVNSNARLDAVSSIWKGIYEKHKNGEPSMHHFLQKYGENMRRSFCNLPALTAEQLSQKMHKIRPSSPGMDSIAPFELHLLAAWCPDICNMLAKLLNTIEQSGVWPSALPKGAVSFIPKTASENPSPKDYRPLTILSSIYRLWASTRHDQLCEHWLPHWKSTQAYGLKQSNAADALAFDTCLQMQLDIQEGYLTSGVSYDMQKCFDSIPIKLVLQVFNHRGADPNVLRALTGFYTQHEKYFQIDGHFSPAYKPSNGILQGCPLSMLLLTSLATTWIEHCQAHLPETRPRSYADDLSICAKSKNTAELVSQTRQMHQITAEFVNDAGMKINPEKCFTFGHKSVSGCLRLIPSHKQQFRLVGGSIKLDNKHHWTDLEQSRAEQWKQSIQNIRPLPISWQEKSTIAQSFMSQFTFGQGTHKLYLTSKKTTHLRATVIRTLLNTDFYDASPAIIFTLLTKPSIEPEFASNLAALQLIFRMIKTRQQKLQILTLINDPTNTPFEIDGPLSRIQQLYQNEIYHGVLHAFLNSQLDFRKWQHELRETFRKSWWRTVARERSQHFAGIEHGINRHLTLAYLKSLESEADDIQYKLDHQMIPEIDIALDPRPKLKILRLLLSAGVQTPERDHRHRKQPGSVTCYCNNGSPTIYHISWECSCFRDIRGDIRKLLPKPLHQLPTRFQYTTIVPNDMNITQRQIMEIQERLVCIWQKQVQMWYETIEPTVNPTSSTPQAPENTHVDSSHNNDTITHNNSASPAIKRGHVLRLIPEGGVFCCRCGKQTKNLKHQRLKILSRPCAYPDLEPAQWLTAPGFNNSIHRIREAENLLNTKYNTGNHTLVWNRKVGKNKTKSDYGLLWCARCGHSWPWDKRTCNLKRSVCQPLPDFPDPPDWVTFLDHYTPLNRQSSAASAPPAHVRRRITGKHPSLPSSNNSLNAASSPGQPSSSSSHPRRGVG